MNPIIQKYKLESMSYFNKKFIEVIKTIKLKTSLTNMFTKLKHAFVKESMFKYYKDRKANLFISKLFIAYSGTVNSNGTGSSSKKELNLLTLRILNKLNTFIQIIKLLRYSLTTNHLKDNYFQYSLCKILSSDLVNSASEQSHKTKYYLKLFKNKYQIDNSKKLDKKNYNELSQKINYFITNQDHLLSQFIKKKYERASYFCDYYLDLLKEIKNNYNDASVSQAENYLTIITEYLIFNLFDNKTIHNIQNSEKQEMLSHKKEVIRKEGNNGNIGNINKNAKKPGNVLRTGVLKNTIVLKDNKEIVSVLNNDEGIPKSESDSLIKRIDYSNKDSFQTPLKIDKQDSNDTFQNFQTVQTNPSCFTKKKTKDNTIKNLLLTDFNNVTSSDQKHITINKKYQTGIKLKNKDINISDKNTFNTINSTYSTIVNVSKGSNDDSNTCIKKQIHNIGNKYNFN